MTALLICLWSGAAFAQRSTPVQMLNPSGTADHFGQAVAIDGDTMLVGAPDGAVGPNSAQGVVRVYRWTGAGWVFESQVTASDGSASDSFGASIALCGDTALVGAAGDNANQGSAYVLRRSGTTWTQEAKLTAAGGAPGDSFGLCVGLYGDTAIVGARGEDIGTNIDQGTAYVFTRTGTTWTLQARLTSSDGASVDLFGSSVAVFGDTAVVGAGLDDVGTNPDQGSAYVFTRTGGTWTQQAWLTASDGSPADWFGNAVALFGDTIIVGAWFDDVGGVVNRGSAYVFVRSGATWNQQAKLNAASTGGAYFGCSVAISGDTAIVGASSDETGRGAAYAFTRSGTTWTQQFEFAAPGGVTGDSLGSGVAISGDVAVAGAPYDDAGQGSAWVISRVASSWIGPDLMLLASGGAADDELGYSVAISGTTAVVGAYLDDVGANANQGSAYVFIRSGTGWTQQAQLTATGGAAEDWFGVSVAISGDTVIVGAPNDDVSSNTNQGSAYVFTRSGTVWTQQAQLAPIGGAAGDYFGSSVAISGDTVIVGAPNDDVGSTVDQGSAFVFVRSGGVWTQQAQLVASDGATSDFFGIAVALVGDTAVVGSFMDDVGGISDEGSAYVFVRTGASWTQQAQLIASGGGAGDRVGAVVALSGDTAIVGAPYDDVGGNTNQGSAYVFVRSGTAWAQQAQLTAFGGAANDYFGTSVSLSGNMAIVGAPNRDVGVNLDQGSAYLFARSGTTWSQQAQIVAPDGAAGDLFGICVRVLGDTAIVGAPLDNVGATIDQGSAWTLDNLTSELSVVHNDVTDVFYTTLAAAMLPAASGQQITGTEASWRSIGSINTLGRSLALRSSGDLRYPSTSTVELGGSSVLAVPTGSVVACDGQLRTSAGASAEVTGDAFTLGSRGILTARTGSSLTINAAAADLYGQTRLEQNASLTFAGSVAATGSTTSSFNASMVAEGVFTNIDTFTLTAGTISSPLFRNRNQMNVFGSGAVFGPYTNDAGAITTIRSGTLFVFGSLTNYGTVVGTLCSNCVGGPPNLDVGGDLVLGSAANLVMPFAGSLVHLGGSFDCAINSNSRYYMSEAELQLEGTGSEQTLEVMSTDIGPDEAGLDRHLPGHYPVGTIHIGPAPSSVRIVDAHDNDNLGQSSCEAVYADTVIIDAGSRVMNVSCRIYYRTLTNDGIVDVPGNLIAIGEPCFADFNQDGGIDGADVEAFFNAWENGDFAADVNQDGGIDDADVETFFGAWEAGGCG